MITNRLTKSSNTLLTIAVTLSRLCRSGLGSGVYRPDALPIEEHRLCRSRWRMDYRFWKDCLRQQPMTALPPIGTPVATPRFAEIAGGAPTYRRPFAENRRYWVELVSARGSFAWLSLLSAVIAEPNSLLLMRMRLGRCGGPVVPCIVR